MAEIMEFTGMGWLRDNPDFNDYTMNKDTFPDRLKPLGQKDSIKGMLKKTGIEADKRKRLLYPFPKT